MLVSWFIMFYFMNIMTLLVDWDCTQKYRLEILAIIIGGSVVRDEQVVIIFYSKYPSFETVNRITRLTKAREASSKLSYIYILVHNRSN